ncbi:MAG: glycosyltransferase family 1 protein [Thomasclavelia sp.]
MNYPIKVLILDTVMDRGGAETMTMNYMRNMDRTKVQYDFLVHRDYKAAYEDEIKALGGKIYRICPIYPQNFHRYKKEIRKFFIEHPEYKIIHCNMSELGYFAYKEAYKLGIPVRICHSHNTPRGINLKSIFRFYFKHRSRKYVTHMFSCSLDAGIWLFGKKNKGRIEIIPNSIDTKLYRYNEKTRLILRKKLGIDDEFVIGHVGRFFEQKNHLFLIDIFNEIIKLNPNSKLVLVGGGELDDSLKNKVKSKIKNLQLESKVIFTGVVDNVYDYMQIFDVFLFPSLFEGFGIVLLEAQASGLHCITSKDVVPQNVNICNLVEYLSLNESPINWAKMVLEYNNYYYRNDMSQKIIDANFDINENSKEMTNKYIKMLEESTR